MARAAAILRNERSAVLGTAARRVRHARIAFHLVIAARKKKTRRAQRGALRPSADAFQKGSPR